MLSEEKVGKRHLKKMHEIGDGKPLMHDVFEDEDFEFLTCRPLLYFYFLNV
jgi:hypothetical protein